MTDLLSSIGLTSGDPDPTAFLKQKEVTGQIDQVRADATTTLGSISFALDAAETIGISGTSLSGLRSLQDRAKKLTDATNMTPAQMEAERTRIEQDLAKVKKEQEGLAKKAELDALKGIVDKVVSERKLIDSDSTLLPEIKLTAKTLHEQAQASVKAVQQAVDADKELPSTVQSASALQSSLDSLKEQRETIENATPSGGIRGIREGLRWAALALMILVLVCSAILGGAVLANTFIDEVFWGIRLYYFIYGAIGFPLSLLYGAIRPPVWQSTILPWTLKESATAEGSSLFSYYLYTADDLVQPVGEPSVPRGERLEQDRSMLRWMSLGGLIASIASVTAYGIVA